MKVPSLCYCNHVLPSFDKRYCLNCGGSFSEIVPSPETIPVSKTTVLRLPDGGCAISTITMPSEIPPTQESAPVLPKSHTISGYSLDQLHPYLSVSEISAEPTLTSSRLPENMPLPENPTCFCFGFHTR